MAWREKEFPAAPKRPEGSGQLSGVSAMAQTVREIQEIQEMMNQIRSLKDELTALTDSVKDDMTGLKESVASLDNQARTYLKSREHIKEVLKDLYLEYSIADEAIDKISTNFAKSLGDHLRKIGEGHNETLNKTNEVFRQILQQTINGGEEKLKDLEKRIKETTSTDGIITIRHKWFYWAFLIFVLSLVWGIFGFLLWYKLRYGTDGMNFLAWATVIAIASAPVYSIIRLFKPD